MFFWAIWAADLGQRASGPGRTKYSSMGPCAIAARELCPIYFNLDVSALVYRGDCNLRLPLRLNLHCKTGLSWRVPSKLLAMARARAQRRGLITVPVLAHRAAVLKTPESLVYGRPTAVFDGSERYPRPKATHENPPHGVQRTKRRRGDHVAVLRVAAAVLSTIASSISRPSRTRGDRRKVDEVELEVARLGARGRQL